MESCCCPLRLVTNRPLNNKLVVNEVFRMFFCKLLLDLMKFQVKYKAATYHLEINGSNSLREIFVYLGEIIDFNHLNAKLVVNGKSFSSDRTEWPAIDAVIKERQTILLLSSSLKEIEYIRNIKSDPLVKGFEREILDEQNRARKTQRLLEENPWGETIKQDETYRFNRTEVLYLRLNPPPFEAEKLLLKLTTDPGIMAIMTSRRWTVGTLCELDPIDADTEQAAKGEGDKCLLGWNRNFGQRIALRLRTDDLKGFRNYASIVNTLIHELTHNAFGPHDEKFWSLFNQLKNEYTNTHSVRQQGTSLTAKYVAPLNLKKEPSATVPTPTRVGGSVKHGDFNELRMARIKALDKT